MTGEKERSDESGFILAQVVILSAILLLLLLSGFRTIRTAIQTANTTATSADFKDLQLLVTQTLADTSSCVPHLGLTGKKMSELLGAGSDGFPVTITDSSSRPIAYEEGTSLLPNSVAHGAGFRIREVRLRNIVPAGWTSGAVPVLPQGNGSQPAVGRQELERYSAEIDVGGERKSGFLGSAYMNFSVMVVLGADPSVPGSPVRTCSTRSVYSVLLGPPSAAAFPVGIARKTGLECVDRGGMPVLVENPPWYACRIPISAFQYCSATTTDLPGWYCYRPTDTAAGVTYVY